MDEKKMHIVRYLLAKKFIIIVIILFFPNFFFAFEIAFVIFVTFENGNFYKNVENSVKMEE